MVTELVIAGRGEAGLIVRGQARSPGMAKVIVWGTGRGVGVEDRLAERAGAGVVGVGHDAC